MKVEGKNYLPYYKLSILQNDVVCVKYTELPRYNWNIVESGVKHHQTKKQKHKVYRKYLNEII